MAKDQFRKSALGFFIPQTMIQLFIGGLAESNRHPYDLPEAEAELVSGYNVEYSSLKFAMFFLGEYSSVVYFTLLFLVTFFNPNATFDFEFFLEAVKMLISTLATIIARALLPRYRYDQLMRSC